MASARQTLYSALLKRWRIENESLPCWYRARRPQPHAAGRSAALSGPAGRHGQPNRQIKDNKMSFLFKSSSIDSCLDDMEADTVELSVLLLGKISQVAPHLVLFFVPRQDTQVVILLELEV